MNSILFDENGILCLDETIASQSTFQKIMEDGIVSEEELVAQSQKVMELFKKVEDICSDEAVEAVKGLLVESCVLHAVYEYYKLQNLKNVI